MSYMPPGFAGDGGGAPLDPYSPPFSPPPPEHPQDDGVPGWYEMRCVAAAGPGAAPDALRALALHPTRELIYAGTASGFLHAHSVEDAGRIASARPDRAVTGIDPAVRDAVAVITDAGDAVVTAVGGGVRVVTRGCAPLASVCGDGVENAAAIAVNPVDATQVCVGGGGSLLAVVHWGREAIIRQAALRGGGGGVTCAEWVDVAGAGSLAVFATGSGRVSVCDPRSLREVNAAAAFPGPVTGLDCRGSMLAVCGMGVRGGVSYVEDMVKLYDVRAMHEPMGTVPFAAGPLCVRFDSWTSSAITGGDALWALSVDGVLQCFELSGLGTGHGVIPVSQEIALDADIDAFTTLAVSSEGLVVCGDTGGFLHQWSASEFARVSSDAEPIWEHNIGPPSMMPPRPSFRMPWPHTLNDTGSMIPMSVFPVEQGLLSDKFVDSLAIGLHTDKKFSGNGGARHGVKLAAKRHDPVIDSLGCGRAPFSRFPPKIAPSTLESANWHDFVAYAKVPPGFVRNSIAVGHVPTPFARAAQRYARGLSKSPKAGSGRFGSSKSPPVRSQGLASPPPMSLSVHDSSSKAGTLALAEAHAGDEAVASVDPTLKSPAGRSSYVEMDLVAWESVDGFDFKRYNQSDMFCGLENALPNVYVNGVVQALYFTPPFRDAMAHHTCNENVCISCELSFLFNMLGVGGAGVAVEAGNFTKAFMTMANAGALGLLDGPSSLPLAARIENFSSYLLEQLHKDAGGGMDTVVARLTGANMISSGKFSPSGVTWERTSLAFQQTLNYDGNPGDFAELVQNSLYYELEPTRAFCSTTGNFEVMSQTRRLTSLPNILLLGSNTKSSSCSTWWLGTDAKHVGSGSQTDRDAHALEAMKAEPRLVPGLRLEIDGESQKLSVSGLSAAALRVEAAHSSEETLTPNVFATAYDLLDENDPHSEADADGRPQVDRSLEGDYELSFVVARATPLAVASSYSSESYVRDADGHLVLYVRVPAVYRNSKSGSESRPLDSTESSQWWCFNDFVIAPCEAGWNEVATFSAHWKQPCLFGYVRRDIRQIVPQVEKPKPLNLREAIGHGVCNAAIGFSDDEPLPGAGDLVGLDCEFVMVQREDCEITGEGRRTVVTPARMALARVSVVRGSGEKVGTPLIDDYVEVKETVVDYLTRFSGICAGDLDPSRSTYSVSQLKTVYKKLLALVDSGVVFVGHGLKKDLRVLNFAVPANQVVDTVVLFREPGKRLLSLRFLVGTLLGSAIQTGGSDGHDSVEDAVAALRLFKAYRDLQSQNRFSDALRALYSYGYLHGWRFSSEQPFVVPE
jgi:DNA polymerase III epsilon subunit-like protein